MEHSRIAIPGVKYTETEYELQFRNKDFPDCLAGFPCDSEGNLIVKGTETWGGEYLLIKNSARWEGPEIVKLTHTRIGRNLIACDCGEKFFDLPDGRGRIICPRCGTGYDGEGRPETAKREAGNGFHIVRKGECA